MEIKMIRLADIKPYENNPRLNDDAVEPVKQSIKRYGFKVPMILDHNNIIVTGHTRYKAAQALGMTEVPVIYADDLTEEQIKEFRLVDNKTAEFAQWDFSKLEEELDGLDFGDFDFGFDLSDGGADDAELSEDDFEAQPPEEPRAQVGDLYQLGNHRLICGDSTDVAVIDRLMDGVKADIAITSPPYGESKSAGIRHHYEKGKRRIESLYEGHDDNIENWFDLMQGGFHTMRTATQAQFINIQMLADNKRELLRFLNDNKDNFVNAIIWDKKKAPPQMESSILNNGFEFIFCFYEEGATRIIPFSDFHGNVTNIIELSAGHNEHADIHKAVYPVELPAKIMEIAKKACSVFDPFGGTGTTLIACEQLNRKCYMCELDPRYIDVIIDRWETFTGKKAVLLEKG